MLRTLIAAGLALALLAPRLDGHAPDWRLVAVGAALALAAAIEPDRPAGTLACCWVLVTWVVTDRDIVGAGALVAAVGLVGAHVAATLTSYGPDRMTPDRLLVLRWIRRAGLVLVPSALVVLSYSLLPVPGGSAGSWLWAAGAVLVAGLAAAVSLAHRAGS
jgi:hypothetical protein